MHLSILSRALFRLVLLLVESPKSDRRCIVRYCCVIVKERRLDGECLSGVGGGKLLTPKLIILRRHSYYYTTSALKGIGSQTLRDILSRQNTRSHSVLL